jgi:hypothetical protein
MMNSRTRKILFWYFLSMALFTILGFVVGWQLSDGQIIAACIGSALGNVAAQITMRWVAVAVRGRLVGRR